MRPLPPIYTRDIFIKDMLYFLGPYNSVATPQEPTQWQNNFDRSFMVQFGPTSGRLWQQLRKLQLASLVTNFLDCPSASWGEKKPILETNWLQEFRVAIQSGRAAGHQLFSVLLLASAFGHGKWQTWRSWDDSLGIYWELEATWTWQETGSWNSSRAVWSWSRIFTILLRSLARFFETGAASSCDLKKLLFSVGMSSKVSFQIWKNINIFRHVDQSKTALGRRTQLQWTPTHSLEPRNNLAFAFFSFSTVSRIFAVSWLHTCQYQLEGQHLRQTISNSYARARIG